MNFNIFSCAVAMLDDDDRDRFGFVFESLIRDAANRIDEIFNRVDNSIGRIILDMVAHGDSVYRDGMIINARLEPIKKAEPVSEHLDVENELSESRQRIAELERENLKLLEGYYALDQKYRKLTDELRKAKSKVKHTTESLAEDGEVPNE